MRTAAPSSAVFWQVRGAAAWLAIALAWATAGFASAAAAEDLPIVTAKNAAELADRRASLELKVVEVKFAERRKMHFLSGASNFRSPDNIPIAIRNVDFAAFEAVGLGDLERRYQGRAVRARGTVTRDEGQWLLVIKTPDEIALVDAPPVGRATGQGSKAADNTTDAAAIDELLIVNEQGKSTRLPVPLPAELKRAQVTTEHDGRKQTYEGVPLSDLLAMAGVSLGAEARADLLGRYLVVRAQDKYAAAFSVAEVDPYYVAQPALVAERTTDGPLPANRAPLQVVVPGDKHRRRWVGQVIRIEVRNALDSPAAAAP